MVDSSVWVDHLRSPIAALSELLGREEVLCHPFIIGELAIGSLKDRRRFIQTMKRLPQAIVARDEEVLAMVDDDRIYGRGVGYIDMHLLASSRLSGPARLWTHDRRFRTLAKEINLAAEGLSQSADH